MNTGLIGQIDFNITDLCNRTCAFCPRGNAEIYPNNNENMSLELFDHAMQQIDDERFKGMVILAGRGESSNHPQFAQILDRLLAPGRRYRTQVTTNGWKLEKWWPWYRRLDNLVLNTYTTRADFEARAEKYPALDNNRPVEAYFKPDGLDIQQINVEPDFEHPTEKNVRLKHLFNHRGGLIAGSVPVKGPCIHPMSGLFINFTGELQMCCNDWSHQIGFGNVADENMFDIYEHHPRYAELSWAIVNGHRIAAAPCEACDVPCPKPKDTEHFLKNFDGKRRAVFAPAK